MVIKSDKTTVSNKAPPFSLMKQASQLAMVAGTCLPVHHNALGGQYLLVVQ